MINRFGFGFFAQFEQDCIMQRFFQHAFNPEGFDFAKEDQQVGAVFGLSRRKRRRKVDGDFVSADDVAEDRDIALCFNLDFAHKLKSEKKIKSARKDAETQRLRKEKQKL
jgi:hypothetical protein